MVEQDDRVPPEHFAHVDTAGNQIDPTKVVCQMFAKMLCPGVFVVPDQLCLVLNLADLRDGPALPSPYHAL